MTRHGHEAGQTATQVRLDSKLSNMYDNKQPSLNITSTKQKESRAIETPPRHFLSAEGLCNLPQQIQEAGTGS